MRLSARGGMIRGGGLELQGKFCLCLKFVLFWRRDAFLRSDDHPIRH